MDNMNKTLRVSEATQAYMNCLQELNSLIEHVAITADVYNSRNIDEVMKPVNEAATSLQQAIIHSLIADSISEAAGWQNITEV